MASYNSILRHVSMADVKRNTWKLQEQKRIDEQRCQEELDLRINNCSSLYSDWRFDLGEGMTTQDMSYTTTLAGEGDTALGAAAGWSGTGGSSSGSTLHVAAGSIELSGGGSFQQATVTAKGMDVTKFDTARVTVTKTFDAGDETDVRIFSNYFSNPNQFFLNAFFDDNYYPLSGGTGVREFAVGGSRSNSDNFKFQVRSAKRKAFDSESGLYVDAPTSRYTVKIELLRKSPMTVFVGLDSPEAASFVRTGEFGELTNEEKKKKLQDMLNASDAYLTNKFGDPFPGTGGDYSFTDVNLPPSWEQAAGEEPGLMMKGLQKQTGGKMAPMPMMKQPTGGNMPTPSGYDLLDQDPKRTTLAQLSPKTEKDIDAMLLKGLERGDYGSGPQIQKQIDSLKRNMRQGTPGGIPKAQKKNKQPVVAHYEPEGEMIVEKKLKKPQEFFKDKDIKPEFPENPPPPQIKGLHPDLVTGEKTAQRFNRLDPISARAMPRTGIKAIDKKVKIASKKPK